MPTNNQKYMKNYYNNLQSELLNYYGNICNICFGSICGNEFLEFAHVKPTRLSGSGRGKINRLIDIKNNRECYLLIGRFCHRLYDNTLL